jgi:hypothetical protein
MKKKPKNKTFTISQTIYVLFSVKAPNKYKAIEKAYSVINAHSVDPDFEPNYNIAKTQANFDVEISPLN